SFSRSAVNPESGAKTGLAGVTMGVIMCSALSFMTPLFRDIPQCALAAIVISAVMGLVSTPTIPKTGLIILVHFYSLIGG
ncbi:hypothetical protein MKW94_006721, partial [Papaver nudicaule]|nr:hypothetical protein [Papaver nudicaule]